MASIEEILGKKIDSVKALRAEIKSLQDSLVGVDAESQEFKDTTEKLTAAQDELTKVTKAGKSENDAAKDSIVGMQAAYKQLYDQYKLLSEEQRNSSFGKGMEAELKNLSNQINETKQGVGNFTSNIGNYTQSAIKAFESMGISVGALKGPLGIVNTSFKGLNATMKANPVGLITTAIAGLIAIFKKMKEAVGQNEELQMRYNEAMAKFQPIIDAAKNALNGLAEGFVSFVEFISNAVQKIREFGAAVTDFLGITKGAKKDLQDEAKLYDDLAKRTNELTKNKREYEKLNAEDQARLDTLKSEAAATTDLAEKKKLLEEAQTLQQQINERNIELATEENALLEIQASLTANDAAMNDKLAASQAKVNQTVAEGAKKMKELNSQMKSTTSSINSAAGATRNYRQEAKELYDKLVDENKTEEVRLTERYTREKKLLERYGIDTTLLTKKYNKEILEIRVKTEKDAITRIETERNNARNNTREFYDKLRKQETSYRESLINEGRISEAYKLEAETIQKEVIPKLNLVKTLYDVVADRITEVDDAAQTLTKDFEGIATFPGFEDLANTFLPKINAEFKPFFEGVKDTNQYLTQPIKDLISISQDMSDKLGIPLDTLQDLTNALKGYNKEYQELIGKSQIEALNKKLLENSIDKYEVPRDYIAYLNSTQEERSINEGTRLYNHLNKEKELYHEALQDFEGTTEQRLEIQKRYYEVLQTLREKDQELTELSEQRTYEMVENLTAAIDSLANAMGTYQSSQESLIDSQLKAGKIDEKEARAKKKRLLDLQKVQLAFNVATITADAASGIFAIWKGYAQERGQINPQTAAAAGVGAGPVLAALNTKSLISAIAQTTSLAATASAQIMAARNGYVAAVNNFNAEGASSSGSEGLASTPALIASEPYTYTQQIQNTEEEDELNQRPVWVSVVDIENAMGHRAQVKDETSF